LKIVTEPPVSERLLDGIQVLPLNVLDERHLEERPFLTVGDLAHGDGDLQQASAFGRAPSAFAGDDLKAVTHLADDDWLDDPVRLNGPGQLSDPRVAD